MSLIRVPARTQTMRWLVTLRVAWGILKSLSRGVFLGARTAYEAAPYLKCGQTVRVIVEVRFGPAPDTVPVDLTQPMKVAVTGGVV